MKINHRNSTKYIATLLLLSFICLVLTFYWSIAIIPIQTNKNTSNNNNDGKLYPSYSSNDLVSHSLASFDLIDGKNSVSERETERDINERKNRVVRLCKQFHLGKYKWSNNTNDLNLKEPPTPLFSYFFWNREKHVAWCPVYKAGSTSWLQNMIRLAGYSEEALQNPPKQLSLWAREVYGDSDNFGKEEIDNTLKLLVVRHPFERLLSAYRDKLSNSTVGHEHGTHHFYIKYGKHIVQKFRKGPSKSFEQIEPTWEEFVRYILKTDLLQYADDHWLPAYYSCTPCLVDYDVIAKTETYFRDQQFIISKAGLEETLKPRWSHSTAAKESQSRLQLRKQYFGQLTKTQVTQLYEKFKLDFLLFGYDYKDYVKLAMAKEL